MAGTPTSSRRSFVKYALGIGTSVLIGGIELRFAPPARAAVSSPSVAGCIAWGAQAARQPIVTLSARPNKIIIHHTAHANTTDFSQAHAYALARSIQQDHFNRGWIDSGQHFTISRGGTVTEGRHRSVEALNAGTSHVQGAHCDGQNDVAIGIENEGTYTSAQPPAALYNQLVALCAYACQQYSIPSSQIYGHRDFNATACPGDKLYAMLPQIRSAVATQLGSGTARTWPVVQRGQSGERVKTVQYLLRARGNTSVAADGAFGSGTESAVKSFQSTKGLPADGIVGAQTWEALLLVVRRGDNNDAVRAVQSQLAITVDGAFGSGTETSVKSFQSANGLTSDGVVGADTWSALAW